MFSYVEATDLDENEPLNILLICEDLLSNYSTPSVQCTECIFPGFFLLTHSVSAWQYMLTAHDDAS